MQTGKNSNKPHRLRRMLTSFDKHNKAAKIASMDAYTVKKQDLNFYIPRSRNLSMDKTYSVGVSYKLFDDVIQFL
ncbi:hypothetical protein IJ22_48060 [Paenibacillus naphthalenovorans]|uniref:Uncharacterized protein n=1 Tax=Paenibacillus naphthalenovorans TaxID=162209 RepID=A0A0U2UPW6_9BACL|nr:hypothetical protein IJ22_48060 [Paenibacillus naphthalenovorans]